MRIIIHEKNEPYKIKIREVPGADKVDDKSKLLDYEIHICACGLSHNKPFCDGSHKITKEERPGELYTYNENKEKLVPGKFYSAGSKL